jgi:hypothetical protein
VKGARPLYQRSQQYRAIYQKQASAAESDFRKQYLVARRAVGRDALKPPPILSVTKNAPNPAASLPAYSMET